MIYKVIGLMSGSSLDGLDIAYVQLEETRDKWSYEILYADCIPYTDEWLVKLNHAAEMPVADFLKLHTRYGRELGEQVNKFISKHNIEHGVHFIASHGHTVFHEPANHTTFQLGDGATIAAVTGLPVIDNLRAMDVALGGQGAPIVPIGDKLLFPEFDYLLNIGGIANITIRQNDTMRAFDICPANQILNSFAEREGYKMDEDGAMAAKGDLLFEILSELNDLPYYRQLPPKSLSNEAVRELIFPILLQTAYSNYDLLHTMTIHIAEQIAEAVRQYPHGKGQAHMLVTGGGAFNKFLIAQLEKVLAPLNVMVTLPDDTTVKFKEALVMALIGTLRWREQVNVLQDVTGASKDSIGGSLWII